MVNLEKYECDRCHKVVKGFDVKTIRYEIGILDSVHFVHLCKQCNKLLHKWVKMKAT